jgi:hypothetical protein
MVLMRLLLAAAAIVCTILTPGAAAWAHVRLDFETGAVFPSYSDVRIPGNTGTKFSLTDGLRSETQAFFRGRFSYTFGGRHTLSVLVAPLSIPASGKLDAPIRFSEATFPAGEELDATYRFDSYRLTYRYALRRTDRLEAGIGLTGKIRDAEIRVESADRVASKKNTGFVPLINFLIRWTLDRRFSLLLEGDALAAPQGRAEDVLVALQFRPSETYGFKAGYRILEGGADNDEVYNFALLNYLVLGFSASY